MQNFQTNRSRRSLRGRSTLVALLAIGALGATAFAAAGGLNMLQTWFLTAEVNGKPVELDGADVSVVTDGNTATITVDGIEGDFKEGDEITITATSDGSGTVSSGAMVKTVKVVPAGEKSDKNE